MRIMVFDVPTDSGGALTILHQYYSKALMDKDNEWFFIVSTPNLKSKDNVKILRYPWVKKSWFHRLFFDECMGLRIAKKYHIDEIISLQNVIVKGFKKKQTMYLQQPLPFIEERFNLLEHPRLWAYQNIIAKIIFQSVRKADKITVQTKWMKAACISKIGIDPEKIEVVQPDLVVEITSYYNHNEGDERLFFFPSSEIFYKNHRVVVKAVQMLKKCNIKNFRVIFTLKGDETCYIKKLYQIVQEHQLPIDFVGYINIEDVYAYYSKSTLVFPSYVETFGLPLLEARVHGCPIIASNCSFSKEILDGYDQASFFDHCDAKQLARMMLKVII